MTISVDTTAVRRYDEAKERLDQLEDKLAAMKQSLENRDSEIDKLKQQWLGPVRDIVAKIDSLFEAMFVKVWFS